MPEGARIELDRTTRSIGAAVLLGGSPRRLLRLSPAGVAALTELRGGVAASPAARALARRLLDGGLAQAVPAPVDPRERVTVVVPARDRAAALERCLASLDREVARIVVDDGSNEAGRIAAVAARHGARLVRRERAGGPAAARNAAIAATNSEVLAFIDSDCVAPSDWISRLLGHFDDPLLAAVAPRVVPLDSAPSGTPARPALRRYLSMRSPLDLGARSAPVWPGTRVAYVPTAALLARRAALVTGFDEQLRYGEDVDLVWRLCDSGERVRYDARVTVAHEEPATLAGLLRRRFRYGSSAGALARRHPRRLAPAALPPAVALTAVLALGGRHRAATALLAGELVRLARHNARLGLPPAAQLGLARESGLEMARALARLAGTVGLPVVALAAARRRRAGLALALLSPPLQRPAAAQLDRIRWAAFAFADDAAYGAGVWWGCLTARRLQPLLPMMMREARR